MPKKLHEIERAIARTGKPKSVAWAMAQATYQRWLARHRKTKPPHGEKYD